ncbi:hypothetical protein PTSG_10079 [Salpingoeca rosetta]|uniref:Tudor domain-containing protein n=1 Tax=Salpingoeca rosetta (strain ATCC 50818 / BSB-021) TaxID=946362 RepID=F2UPF3_SALR5|nr:uncharacterized protein PTSG_10079 [Salpingoeca rosetta]EGD79508.1 hypothetical protein PTSG_10079 [Salpingoeca rosetta]|eukprot:XP_004988989.1 hypothetical protein PTSG_10079 [Salpingoeca rosetta]
MRKERANNTTNLPTTPTTSQSASKHPILHPAPSCLPLLSTRQMGSACSREASTLTTPNTAPYASASSSQDPNMDATVAQLRREKEALERENRTLKTELAASQEENKTLQSRVQELQAQVSKLEREQEAAATAAVATPNTSMLADGMQALGISSPMSPQPTSSQPRKGDRVISHWKKWQFYPARIAEFNRADLTFTVDFDDGDQTSRVQKVELVALDRTPDADEIGVGSVVLFPQGRYRGNDAISGGVHWHLGRITRVRSENGERVYDGCHLKGADDGKWITFKGYAPTFEGLRLKDMRVSPNVLNMLTSGMSSAAQQAAGAVDKCDVFISYCRANCLEDITARDLEARGFTCWMNMDHPNASQEQVALAIKHAKLVVACVSNEYADDSDCRSQFQFAKKLLRKTTVPVVVGRGSWEWQQTVVGLLIAGDLYIDFQNMSNYSAKFEELVGSIKTVLNTQTSGNQSATTQAAAISDDVAKRVFISYCWTNSFLAKTSNQVPSVAGNEFNDPRRIKDALANQGLESWIDIEQIQADDSGLFESITKVHKVALCMFAGWFALKSLKKPIIPVIVGDSDAWKETAIGLLLSNMECINLQDVTPENFANKLEEIVSRVKTFQTNQASPTAPAGPGASSSSPSSSSETESRSRVPKVGDRVISHWTRWSFFPATINSFDSETRSFTVDFLDGDTEGRVQPFDLVALDRVPDVDEVGVGSHVLFPQGMYRAQGERDGGVRFHMGVVEHIDTAADGTRTYSGRHLKGEADGKWVTYKDYSATFSDLRLDQLRMSPNVMDLLDAN